MAKNLPQGDILKLLNALDAVRDDYTCGFCSKLCSKPVTLSTCLHIICSDHIEGLKNCPKCKMPIIDNKIFEGDPELEASVQATQKLCDIFKRFRTEKTNIFEGEPHTEDSEKRKHDKKLKVKVNTVKDTDLNVSALSSSSKTNKDIEKKNIKGETLLHVCSRNGKVDRVVELLRQGADPNTKDNAGWTPLHEAVQNGHFDLVKVLLQYNTLVNVPGQCNETPLHEAVRYNHKDIATELVKHGADLNARNCKGETPLQLAAQDMKVVLTDAAENLCHTQDSIIKHIASKYSELDFETIRLYCCSKSRTVLSKLKILYKSHSNLHIEAKLSKKITHLIVDTNDGVCVSSIEILQGIVNGIWILSSDWVIKSTETKLEKFEAYEVQGVGNKSYKGPRNARYNKYKQLPGIFNGCHFYFYNFTTPYEVSKSLVITKDLLNKLVNESGGVVLRRVPNPESIPEMEALVPYHAKKGGKLEKCSHYIIYKDMYEPMYNMAHIKALPIGWFIECLEKYELCEPW
ncbi:unnamed protein product [Leptidea sinapis]|uniref:BRCT domain-containing protein n=1 Tax=Leptidea sinapis TaxID=189913 RepID=A0A5E4R093_9NEOP|nr:unnamed protein product [Leptidea sinapis]